MLAHKARDLSRDPVDDRRWRWLAALGLSAGLMLTTAPAASWTAAIQPDPLTRQPRCLLGSESVTTSAGYDDTTPVSLVFNGSSLLVVTQSDLDPSFADLQLVVDKNPPVRSEKTAHKTILIFDQDLPDLIRQLREGRQATVYLRFWPTWPATQSFPINFSLVGFSKSHDIFSQNCQPPTGSNPVSR
ncbi:MAG: hypothetical protein V9G09_02445 [Candidatus Nanopelagicales bacterium]